MRAIAYKSNRNVYYLCKYHVVWCPKYRRKVLTEAIAKRLGAIINEVCQEHQVEVLSLEIMPDHVHLFVQATPTIAPNRIIAAIKGYTSHELRKEFPELTHRLPTLWTRSYFVSSHGNITVSAIKSYISEQKGI